MSVRFSEFSKILILCIYIKQLVRGSPPQFDVNFVFIGEMGLSRCLKFDVHSHINRAEG